MNRFSMHIALCLAMFVTLGASVPGAAGTLTGMVSEAQHGGVEDAVVWAIPKASMPSIQPPHKHAQMAQKAIRFQPRVLPILLGTTVDFPNKDNVFHSLYSFSRTQRFETGLYRPGDKRSVKFETPGIVNVFCNIHDNMRGSILVLQTPYFTTTSAAGTFTLPSLPAGEYTVKVWHQRLSGAAQTASITDAKPASVSFVLKKGRPRKNP